MKKFSEILKENLSVNEVPKRINSLKEKINKLPLSVNDKIKSFKDNLIDQTQVSKLTLVKDYLKSINDTSKNQSTIENEINSKLIEFLNSDFIENITTEFEKHYKDKDIAKDFVKYQNLENLLDVWFEKSNNQLDKKLLLDFITEELLSNFKINSYLHRSFSSFLNENIFLILDKLKLNLDKYDDTTKKGAFEEQYFNQINTHLIPIIENKFSIEKLIRSELAYPIDYLLSASQLIKNETILITKTQYNITKTEELEKKSTELEEKSTQLEEIATEIDVEFGKFKAKVKTGSIIVAICFMIMVGFIFWIDKDNSADLEKRVEKLENLNTELTQKHNKLEEDVNHIIIQNDRLIKELKSTQETFNKLQAQ